MCKTLGFSLGLTEKDFDKAVPVRGALVHTAVCIHGIFLVSVVEMRAMAHSTFATSVRSGLIFPHWLPRPAHVRALS